MNILITGATSGIGQSIANHLHTKGHNVIGFGRRVEDELKQDDISWLKMDVTKEDAVKKAIAKAVRHFKHIHVLIQCAGRGAIGPVEAFTAEEIEDVMQLNVYGIQRVNRAVIPIMRQQAKGRIIMISSLAAEAGIPFNGIYSASKAMLENISESLCMEVKQFGIEVCTLQPGDFNTDVSSNRKEPVIDISSPYKEQFERINATATDNVKNASDPIKVAYKVEKILNKKRLKPRYRVGTPLELIMPLAKVILPSRWFQKLLMSYYDL